LRAFPEEEGTDEDGEAGEGENGVVPFRRVKSKPRTFQISRGRRRRRGCEQPSGDVDRNAGRRSTRCLEDDRAQRGVPEGFDDQGAECVDACRNKFQGQYLGVTYV
jgi:hypothetical protein